MYVAHVQFSSDHDTTSHKLNRTCMCKQYSHKKSYHAYPFSKTHTGRAPHLVSGCGHEGLCTGHNAATISLLSQGLNIHNLSKTKPGTSYSCSRSHASAHATASATTRESSGTQPLSPELSDRTHSSQPLCELRNR